MTYDPTKHHRRSIRLQGFDYTQPGAYFITIDTHERICLFGEVVDKDVILSRFGQVAHREWTSLSKRFKHLSLDAFIVMPNHLHGILIINENDCTGTAEPINTQTSKETSRAPTSRREQFGHPVPGSIPTIVRSYKSAVTQQINLIRSTPGATIWQRNYYEHIIRSDAEMERIRKYILDNPYT